MSSKLTEEPDTPKTQAPKPRATYLSVASGLTGSSRPTTRSRRARPRVKAHLKQHRETESKVVMQSLTPKGHKLGHVRKRFPEDWATRTPKARSNWLRRERRRLAKDPAKAEAARVAFKRRRGKLKQKRKGPAAPSAVKPPLSGEPESNVRLVEQHPVYNELVQHAAHTKAKHQDQVELLDDEVNKGHDQGYVVIPAIPSNMSVFKQHAPDGVHVAENAMLPCSVEAALMYLACQTISLGSPAGSTFVCFGCHPSWLANARHKQPLDSVNWTVPGVACGEVCPCLTPICNHMLPYSNVIIGPGYAGKWKTLSKLVGGKSFLIYLDGKNIRKVRDGSRLEVSVSNLEAFSVLQTAWSKRPGLRNTVRQLGSVRIRERGQFAGVAAAIPGSVSRLMRGAQITFGASLEATERVLAACKLGPRTLIHAGEWILDEQQPVSKDLVDIVELAGFGRPNDKLTERLQQRTAVREVLSGEHTLFMGAAATAVASWHYAARRSLLRSFRWLGYRSVTEAMPYLSFAVGGIGLYMLLRPRDSVVNVTHTRSSVVEILALKSVCLGFIRASGLGKGILSPLVAGLIAAPAGVSAIPSAVITEAGLSTLPLPISIVADFTVSLSGLLTIGALDATEIVRFCPLWLIESLSSYTKTHLYRVFPNWMLERWIEMLRWLASEKRATIGHFDM